MSTEGGENRTPRKNRKECMKKNDMESEGETSNQTASTTTTKHKQVKAFFGNGANSKPSLKC